MLELFGERRTSLAALALFAVATAPVSAAARQTSPSGAQDILGTLTRCRDIQADTARLACFDAAAERLAAAGEVAIVSRQEVQQNQRRLFGFGVSIINPFDHAGRTEEVQSISATLTSARNLGRGEWLITLDDGSTWRKIDAGEPSFSTRRQHPVTVRRAAMGSYMMKVGDTPPFRVRRE